MSSMCRDHTERVLWPACTFREHFPAVGRITFFSSRLEIRKPRKIRGLQNEPCWIRTNDHRIKSPVLLRRSDRKWEFARLWLISPKSACGKRLHPG